jgi:hypothetical protein
MKFVKSPAVPGFFFLANTPLRHVQCATCRHIRSPTALCNEPYVVAKLATEENIVVDCCAGTLCK